VTVYTIAATTFWTLGAPAGLGDGSSYANRMTIPADITGIVTTDTAGRYLYIVRETNDLTVSCGNGNCTFYNTITITGDAVGGVYPDDPTVGYRLALSNVAVLYVLSGNMSYVHLGMSDYALTVSRVASSVTFVGYPSSATEIKRGIHLYMYKSSIGTATGHYVFIFYPSHYLRETTIKKDPSSATWLENGMDISGEFYWHDFTIVVPGICCVGQFAPRVYIIGTITFSCPTAYNNDFIDVTKVRTINIRAVDVSGNPYTDILFSIEYTGGETNYNRITNDIFRCRKTDATGRPHLTQTIIRNYNALFTVSQIRNEMRALFVPYNIGYLKSGTGYVQISAVSPTIKIWAMNAGIVKTVTQAMASDYGTDAVPIDITIPAYTVPETFQDNIAVLRRKKSTDTWIPIRLMDANKLGVVGQLVADLEVEYKKESDTAWTAYVPIAAEWKEQGHGYYSLNIGAGEFTTSNVNYMVKVRDILNLSHVYQCAVEVNDDSIDELMDNIGTPANIDGGGASIAANIKKLADDNGGATFDATTDSQNKISANIGNPSARTNLKSIETMLGNPDTALKSIYTDMAKELSVTGVKTDTNNIRTVDVPAITGAISTSEGNIRGSDSDDLKVISDQIDGVATNASSAAGDASAINSRLPSDPADESDIEGAISTSQGVITGAITTSEGNIEDYIDGAVGDITDAITTSEENIRGTDDDDLKVLSDQLDTVTERTENLPDDPASEASVESAITTSQGVITGAITTSEENVIEAVESIDLSSLTTLLNDIMDILENKLEWHGQQLWLYDDAGTTVIKKWTFTKSGGGNFTIQGTGPANRGNQVL